MSDIRTLSVEQAREKEGEEYFSVRATGTILPVYFNNFYYDYFRSTLYCYEDGKFIEVTKYAFMKLATEFLERKKISEETIREFDKKFKVEKEKINDVFKTEVNYEERLYYSLGEIDNVSAFEYYKENVENIILCVCGSIDGYEYERELK